MTLQCENTAATAGRLVSEVQREAKGAIDPLPSQETGRRWSAAAHELLHSLFLKTTSAFGGRTPSPAMPPLLNKLADLRSLKLNWNGRGAARPNDDAFESANEALALFAGTAVRPDRVAPSALGGVTIYFVEPRPENPRRPRYVGLDCLNTGGIVLATVDTSHKKSSAETVDLDSRVVERIRRFLGDAP